ncbi:hypothetical protein PF003_g20777 [Phytophthora fragariae]|nr:hypothetical protein PF003_g20777 [Phytophthora fragariae]
MPTENQAWRLQPTRNQVQRLLPTTNQALRLLLTTNQVRRLLPTANQGAARNAHREPVAALTAYEKINTRTMDERRSS